MPSSCRHAPRPRPAPPTAAVVGAAAGAAAENIPPAGAAAAAGGRRPRVSAVAPALRRRQPVPHAACTQSLAGGSDATETAQTVLDLSPACPAAGLQPAGDVGALDECGALDVRFSALQTLVLTQSSTLTAVAKVFPNLLRLQVHCVEASQVPALLFLCAGLEKLKIKTAVVVEGLRELQQTVLACVDLGEAGHSVEAGVHLIGAELNSDGLPRLDLADVAFDLKRINWTPTAGRLFKLLPTAPRLSLQLDDPLPAALGQESFCDLGRQLIRLDPDLSCCPGSYLTSGPSLSG